MRADQPLHLRLGDAQLVLLHVEIGLRRDVAAAQLLRARQLLAPEIQIRARQVQARARLRERGRVVAVVEPHERLARLHRLALVDEVVLDAARHAHAERDVAVARHHVAGAREHRRRTGSRRASCASRRPTLHLRRAAERRAPGEEAPSRKTSAIAPASTGLQPGRPRRRAPAAAVDAQRGELVAHRAARLAGHGLTPSAALRPAAAARRAARGRSRRPGRSRARARAPSRDRRAPTRSGSRWW